MTRPALIQATDLTFAWPGARTPILDIPEFSVATGERVFLRGASGSGKSTLLGLICGVLQPQSGQLRVLDQPMQSLGAARRDRLRADHLGIIFQLFNLLPYLSVAQNVMLPIRFSGRRSRALNGPADAEVSRLLGALGLDDRGILNRKSVDLSVGQQQRVAAARALIGRPDIVIADEPTSALDSDTRDRFIGLLKDEAARSGATLLFVSHDRALASHFDRTIELGDLNSAAQNAS